MRTQAKDQPKKPVQSINHMTIDEVAKFLLEYVRKSNKVLACVNRNRGGRKESTFNESEVESEANSVISRVVKKIEEYRKAREDYARNLLRRDELKLILQTKIEKQEKFNAEEQELDKVESEIGGFVEKRQFEDVPLLIMYYDSSFENAMRDFNGKASALMRRRYSEVLHSLNEVTLDELHGSWTEVQEREKSDILNDVVAKLKEILVEEDQKVTEKIVKGFLLLFKERVQTDKEFAKDLSLDFESALELKDRIFRLLTQFCQTEMADLLKILRDNKSYWEVGRDEAKASNKTKEPTEGGLCAADMHCEVSSVARMTKQKTGGVQLEILVQVMRENGKPKEKEIVEVVESIKMLCPDFPSAMTEKQKYALKVKDAERRANRLCQERRLKAKAIFGAELAA